MSANTKPLTPKPYVLPKRCHARGNASPLDPRITERTRWCFPNNQGRARRYLVTVERVQ